jgi:hypothetical protein
MEPMKFGELHTHLLSKFRLLYEMMGESTPALFRQ